MIKEEWLLSIEM